ncbi:permease [Candidatus Micrarchaeota archaeon]|nr:permease [Candidatus Micrarchaeota archaeon]
MENGDKLLLGAIIAVFLAFYFLPADSAAFPESYGWLGKSVSGGIELLGEYAKEHILTCLIPALFIAGAITVFIKKESVLKYLGREADKRVAYAAASVSGAVLAVCSCTILPLFAGIRKNGAGLGPAITFLFAGPAINIAAIFLTFSVLGYEIGLARAVASIGIAMLAGLMMAFLFREKDDGGKMMLEEHGKEVVSTKILVLFFGLMLGVLIVNGLQIDPLIKYSAMGAFALGVAGITLWKLHDHIAKKWLEETWEVAKIILPLLFIGVFAAGFIMPLLPEELVVGMVGQNTVQGNLVAAVFGAFMYFSTLTEIPILQILMAKGMASGPALSLLLAGPSLSLPNMLVIRGVIGTRMTAAYISIVIMLSTVAGFIFGSL